MSMVWVVPCCRDQISIIGAQVSWILLVLDADLTRIDSFLGIYGSPGGIIDLSVVRLSVVGCR
jgi:hypothetical protein